MKRKEINPKDKWNLEQFYHDEETYNNDYQQVLELLKEIVAMKGTITTSSTNLYKFLELDDRLSQLLENIYVYSYLVHYSDTTKEEGKIFKDKADKLEEQVSNETSFVSSELLSKDYEYIKSLMTDDKFSKYQFSMEKMFRFKKYTLSEKEEYLLSLAGNALNTSDNAYSALDNSDVKFDNIIVDGKNIELNHGNYLKLISHHDREVRKQTFKSYYKFYMEHKDTLAELYKGQVKADLFYSKARGYKNYLEAALYGDNIKEEVYQKLIKNIHKNLDPLHEYVSLRKKMLNVKELHMYDMYVDLVGDNSKTYTFNEAKNKVFKALSPLGETYLNDLNKMFDEQRIDIYPNDGKRSGAYQWGSYKTGPFVSLNFDGTEDSVSTMAHELGHAMHSFYSKKYQDYNNSNYPIFLAEIASTVNETLLSEYNILNATNDEEKLLYLIDFLDRFRTTIYRQTMFAEFESIAHENETLGKALTSDTLKEIYYNLNKKYYGKDVVSDEEIAYEWSRIPHFYTPFYVYKYATGLISALAIAQDILDNKENALTNYLSFLSSGCSKYPLDTLKICNVDMTQDEAFNKAIKMFEERLEMAKEIIKKEYKNDKE